MIGKQISHHKILEELGHGGMGAVYKAEDTKLHRIVALKCLPSEFASDPEAKQRFLNEAQASSALNHPNIATIYYTFEEQGQEFICMEYVEGQTLAGLLGSCRLPTEQVIDIALQVADGLSEAHKKGIIHRDVKPDNLIVTPRGLVKIMDFGLAKLRGVAGLTVVGSTLGTIAYMSPEQAQGLEVDSRTDIFSLGVVLFEMLSGHRPFQGEYEAAILYSLQNEDPEPFEILPDKLSPTLTRVIVQTLQKDRNDRYQTMDEVLVDLKTAKQILEGTPAPISPGYVGVSGTSGEFMDPEQLVGKTIGNYQIIEEIGRGGMGIVFKALQISLNRVVALKVLPKQFATDQEFLARFRREAKAAANLGHPSIIQIFDIDHQSGIQYFVMEYIEGENLKTLIEREGALPLERAIDITWDTCKALDFAHKNGVVHRDIKPHNIMITPNGDTKVFDFGIARAADSSGLTTTGTNIGTPQYMSPEQARGETDVDGRADLYSLGVVLHEMLTGSVPFEANTAVGTMYRHVNEEPEPPSKKNPMVPPELDDVVKKALEKKPEERYQDGEEMIADLHHAKLRLKLRTAEETTAKGSKTVKHRRPIAALAVLAILILCAAGAYHFGLIGPRYIVLTTNVVGASVYEKGVALGTTPLKMKPERLGLGEHTLLFSMSGYADELFTFDIKPNTRIEHSVSLSDSFGELVVNSVPQGVLVTIDQSERGTPPDAIRLAAGFHTVALSLEGYETRLDTVELAVGLSDTLRSTLTPLLATVTITSEPDQASLIVDGKAIEGYTPIDLQLPLGEHSLRISKNGFATVDSAINLDPGSLVDCKFTLREVIETPAYGVLRVAAIPWAEVYLENRKLGTTEKDPSFGDIKPGRYGIKLVCAGYPSLQTTVQIGKDEETLIDHDFTATGSVNITCVDENGKAVYGEIYIDDEATGATTPSVIENLFVGHHTVKIVAEGYEPVTEHVKIKKNDSESITLIARPAE